MGPVTHYGDRHGVHGSPVEGMLNKASEGGQLLDPLPTSLQPDPFRTHSASAHLFPGFCLCLQDSAHWASVFRVFWKMRPLGKASWSTYQSFADVCKYLSGVWHLHTAKGSGPDSAPVFRAHSIFLIKKKVTSLFSKYPWLHSLRLILTQSL